VRSSIRFERLKEGIQDAEKIRILRKKLQRAGTVEAGEKLKILNQTLDEFNIIKRPEDLNALFRRGKNSLEELSRQENKKGR
jgi:hypothetical protein